MSRLSAAVLLACLTACQRSSAPAPAAPPKPAATASAAQPSDAPGSHAQDSHTAAPAKVVPLAVCEAHALDPLSAARKYYDEGKFDAALACAAQASAEDPDNANAHSERAAALAALERYDDAALFYARALALDPDHLDALLGAAYLYGVTLPSSRERDELAATYAEHGLAVAKDQGDKALLNEFALVSAMTLNDLGESKQALERAEQVLKAQPRNDKAAYEKAIALFELCRFSEAKAAFTAMLKDPEHGAHAHHHLGLLLEREGKWAEAQQHFDIAHKLLPDDFPDPELLSQTEFRAEVDKAVKALPKDMQRDLQGVPVVAEDLPSDDDLLSGDPPLSPSILGLFRGPSLHEACTAEDGNPCRSVAVYRRNLARAVRSRDELIEQIRVTLLHEVGHLRGEDDFELAARGLE